ncbi:urease accessory protein UreF [Bifidobacterium sp. MA2]|uniref:Urease accessory protein UreF n=1 Tax=Bifidobacterium santillanense TaxID=2809028 RepID=A0ABS5UQ54_9BIFI|nr:urease accessory UreF family protein [Bifidobacterium santillanense]MBT1173064.1 urease accessory protein UreF [Bifidobacterium santillanense]
MTMKTADIAALNDAQARHLAMLQVCDSVFPVGAFALSNGMETFVQREFLRRGADFEQYVRDYLAVAPYKEIGQMTLAGRYGTDGRLSAAGLERKIVALDELASALQSAREIREGSERMCTRLIKLVRQMDAAGANRSQAPHRTNAGSSADTIAVTEERPQAGRPAPADRSPDDEIVSVHEHRTERRRLEGATDALYGSPKLDMYARLIDEGRCRGVHAIAMGLYAADHATDVRSAAVTYGYSLLSALTMCAAKAIPLSQYVGQVALHDSFPRLVRAVDIAMTLHPDDLGISGAYLDIAAMQHETLYSRLYMS